MIVLDRSGEAGVLTLCLDKSKTISFIFKDEVQVSVNFKTKVVGDSDSCSLQNFQHKIDKDSDEEVCWNSEEEGDKDDKTSNSTTDDRQVSSFSLPVAEGEVAPDTITLITSVSELPSLETRSKIGQESSILPANANAVIKSGTQSGTESVAGSQCQDTTAKKFSSHKTISGQRKVLNPNPSPSSPYLGQTQTQQGGSRLLVKRPLGHSVLNAAKKQKLESQGNNQLSSDFLSQTSQKSVFQTTTLNSDFCSQGPAQSKLKNKESSSIHPQTIRRKASAITSKKVKELSSGAKHNGLSCFFCLRSFKTKRLFHSHKTPCRIMKVCMECGSSSRSEALHLVHTYQNHTPGAGDCYDRKNKEARCHICNESVSFGGILNHIMRKHTGEHPYECCVCLKPIASTKDWEKHGKVHLRSQEESSQLKEKTLTRHLSVKPSDPEKRDKLYCILCKLHFSSENDFFRHHKSESVKRTCELCNTLCHSKAGFRIHMDLCHGILQSTTTCGSNHDQSNPSSKLDIEVGQNSSASFTVSSNYSQGSSKLNVNNAAAALSSDSSRMWFEDDPSNDFNTEVVNCSECFDSFPVKDLLSHFMKSHTQESLYSCCVCIETFSTLDEYLKHSDFHLGRMDLPKGTCRCKDCCLFFVSRVKMHNHKVKHILKCSFCDQQFQSKSVLDVHLKNNHLNEMTPCRTCSKLFANKTQLADHERNHFYHKDRRAPCPICGEVLECLSQHMERKHPRGDKLYECSLCGQKFETVQEQNSHKRQHLDQSQSIIRCDMCSKIFKTRRGLRVHSRLHLKEQELYTCRICGKTCTQRHNLAVHMRIHSNMKPFSCEHCDQSFNYNQSLKAHIQKHHTTKPKHQSISESVIEVRSAPFTLAASALKSETEQAIFSILNASQSQPQKNNSLPSLPVVVVNNYQTGSGTHSFSNLNVSPNVPFTPPIITSYLHPVSDNVFQSSGHAENEPSQGF